MSAPRYWGHSFTGRRSTRSAPRSAPVVDRQSEVALREGGET